MSLLYLFIHQLNSMATKGSPFASNPFRPPCSSGFCHSCAVIDRISLGQRSKEHTDCEFGVDENHLHVSATSSCEGS